MKRYKETAQAGSDRIANRVAMGINWAQKRWSEVMTRLMGKLSLKSRWTVFVGFILVMVGLNSYLLIASIIGKKKYLDSKVKITVPALPANPMPAERSELPDDVHRRLKDFKMKIDSLGKTASGIKERDSILKGRKGLIDSITRIEELYQQLNNQ